MKVVDPYTKSIGQLKDTEAASKTGSSKAKAKKAESTEAGDRVNLSDGAKIAAKSRALVEEAPEVRVERIESIKAQVEAGEYKVDPEEVARKMVDEHLSELL